MPDDETPTLGAYLRTWLESQRERLRPSTLASYTGIVERHLVPHLGDVPLDQLDADRVDRVYHHLLTSGGRQGTPLAIRTVGTVASLLRRALDDACAAELLERNVAADLQLPHVQPRTGDDERAAVHAWTRDEVHRFLDVVSRHPLAPFLRTAVSTGARRNELLAMTWDDVDLERRAVRIDRTLVIDEGRARRHPLRASRPRTVHIDLTTVAALTSQREAQERLKQAAGEWWSPRWPLVFTGDDGRHLDPANVVREFRELVRLAGVTRIAFNDLRHTHALLLLQLGIPIRVLSARLGHRTLQQTVDTYGHDPQLDREAADQLGACLPRWACAAGTSQASVYAGSRSSS